MGRNPAFQFYPSDWIRDMGPYSLEICGAWINILCSLFWDGGKQTKTIDEWARILREKRKKTEEILDFFEKKGIANIERLDNQNITIISRRMVRDFEISKIRQEVGKLGGNPGLNKIKKNREVLDNQTANQKDQSSSSSSSSVQITPLPPTGVDEPKEEKKEKVIEFSFPDWIPQETWDAYLLVRDKKRAARTPYAYNLVIKELLKIKKEHGQDPLTVLNKSITNGWTDVYPIKDYHAGNSGSTRSTPHNDPNTQCPNCKKVVLKTDIINGKCFSCDTGGKLHARIGDL